MYILFTLISVFYDGVWYYYYHYYTFICIHLFFKTAPRQSITEQAHRTDSFTNTSLLSRKIVIGLTHDNIKHKHVK